MWLRWPVGHAELLPFVLSICFSFFIAQLFYFGNRLEIVDFLRTKKTKGNMFEPGINQRPVFLSFRLSFSIFDSVWTRPQSPLTVLEDHSVTVDWVARWFMLYKRRKYDQVQILIWADWVAQFYTRYTNKRGPGFKSHLRRRSVFLKCIFLN